MTTPTCSSCAWARRWRSSPDIAICTRAAPGWHERHPDDTCRVWTWLDPDQRKAGRRRAYWPKKEAPK